MTNENAINILRHLSPPRTSKAAFDAFKQAIDMAIEALSQPELTVMDLISRQAVIDALGEYLIGKKCPDDGTLTARLIENNVINKLPPAGLHWISIEQDLPKIDEYVLCKTTSQYFGKYHVCKFVDKDEWVDRPHFDWDRRSFPHVIAWTRFEPYKEV